MWLGARGHTVPLLSCERDVSLGRGGACADAERPWQRCPAGHVVLLPNRLLVPEPGGRLRARPGAAGSGWAPTSSACRASLDSCQSSGPRRS